jgi:hypothetical protein
VIENFIHEILLLFCPFYGAGGRCGCKVLYYKYGIK